MGGKVGLKLWIKVGCSTRCTQMVPKWPLISKMHKNVSVCSGFIVFGGISVPKKGGGGHSVMGVECCSGTVVQGQNLIFPRPKAFEKSQTPKRSQIPKHGGSQNSSISAL